MKFIKIFFLLEFFSSFLLATILYSSQEMGLHAKDAAFNGALCAVGEDVSVLYYNPAALTNLKRKEFVSSYAYLNSETQTSSQKLDWTVSFALPIKENIRAFAFSWRQFSQGGFYKEQIATAGYATRVFDSVSLGFGAHYLQRYWESENTFFENEELKPNVGINFGALFFLSPHWRLGGMFEGLNDPKPAISFNNRGTLRSGIGYQSKTFSAAAQVNVRRSIQNLGRDLDYILALEKWFLSQYFSKADWAFRTSISANSQNTLRYAVGGAYRLGNFQFDYAYMLPFEINHPSAGQSNHRLTLSFKFGETVSEKEWEKEKTNPYQTWADEYPSLYYKFKKSKQEIVYYALQTQKDLKTIQELKENLPNVPESSLKDVFDSLWAQYWAQSDEGFCLVSKNNYLKLLSDFFKSKNVSFEKVQEEITSVHSQLEQVKNEFSQDWKNYKQQVFQNATKKNRAEILFKMVSKYACAGSDLSEVKQEIEGLEK